VAQQDCIPGLLGHGDKRTELVDYEEKNICTGPTIPVAAKAGQNLLYYYDEPNETTKEYVFLESPFASVSPVSRGHPGLVSLVKEFGSGSKSPALIYEARFSNSIALGFPHYEFNTIPIRVPLDPYIFVQISGFV
jgi:hypothetical protein